MDEQNKIVARFLDGRVLKGTTEDFFPNRPFFHLHLAGGAERQEIHCRELKAVFFVKDLAGNPERKDVHGFEAGSGEQQGRKIAVRFKDGEVIFGYTLTYAPERKGFFLLPSDAGSNNIRVYVLKHATAQVALGPKAEALVLRSDAKAA